MYPQFFAKLCSTASLTVLAAGVLDGHLPSGGFGPSYRDAELELKPCERFTFNVGPGIAKRVSHVHQNGRVRHWLGMRPCSSSWPVTYMHDHLKRLKVSHQPIVRNFVQISEQQFETAFSTSHHKSLS